jgi:hypothetical protein
MLSFFVLPVHPSVEFLPKFPGLEDRACFLLKNPKLVAQILSDSIHDVESGISMQS